MRTMDLILNITITIKINIHYAAFLFFSIFFDVVGWLGDCLYMMFCCPYEDVKGVCVRMSVEKVKCEIRAVWGQIGGLG